MAQWLSWLERRPVTAKVVGSSPIWVVFYRKIKDWDLSSAGRASALQAEGHRFEPCRSHLQFYIVYAGVAELADAQDLKSCGTNLPYRFDSGRRHKIKYVCVAQLDRALGYGPRCRGFESSHARSLKRQTGYISCLSF